MSRWYRAYEGTVSDPKLAEAALIAGQSRGLVIAVWHSILEAAARENAGGKFVLPARRVALMLAESEMTIEAIMAAIESLEMNNRLVCSILSVADNFHVDMIDYGPHIAFFQMRCLEIFGWECVKHFHVSSVCLVSAFR